MAPDGMLPLPLARRPAAKRCKRCWQAKPLTEFHYRQEAHRYRAECKDCYRAHKTARRDHEDNRRRVKEWQRANPDKKRAQSRRNYENRRADLKRWVASNLRTTRASCKKRNIECSITADDVVAIHADQEGLCALTGRLLIFGSKGQQRDSLSIDRIDQKGGYVLGNIRLVTYQANMARGP